MYTISYPSGTIRKDGAEVLSGPEMDAYVAWLSQGNGPEVLQDPQPLPRIVVSAWQIRKALNQMGLRDAIEAAVEASTDRNTKDGWCHATEFESDHALILGMRTAFGMSEAEMYAVFQLAETL